MTTPRLNAHTRSLVFSIAVLTLASLTACAGQPKGATASTTAAAPEALCKTGETIGFSCEMRDRRVIALCASPGFEKFQGDPKDNPGYAYLTITNTAGQTPQSFPAQAKDYRQHMSTGVTLAGAPYLNVATDKGTFFYVNGRTDIPVSSNPQNQPAGWSLPSSGDSSLCTGAGHRERFDAVLSQMPKKAK